ncbi:hypothetical protein [Roseospira visakhapatnamensis]|uniref:Uncharacterized protein n=1 Tax=Roseospira visakhapatnamensis TaxID=390880 RepID=A0A7W6RGT2_9PROT|nr:hypothetical protein [Roseospira visakhapatnamensis]MBB4267764.1 hypothetical protein [Roseospira visakhapatnamensis]
MVKMAEAGSPFTKQANRKTVEADLEKAERKIASPIAGGKRKKKAAAGKVSDIIGAALIAKLEYICPGFLAKTSAGNPFTLQIRLSSRI